VRGVRVTHRCVAEGVVSTTGTVGTSDACRSSDRGNGTNMTSISMSRDAQQQRAAAERTGSHGLLRITVTLRAARLASPRLASRRCLAACNGGTGLLHSSHCRVPLGQGARTPRLGIRCAFATRSW
jgi:hypothetical protein